MPRLLWWYDDTQSGWVVLAFEEVHGHHPAEPWKSEELDLVLVAFTQLAERLTPPPPGVAEVPTASEIVALTAAD